MLADEEGICEATVVLKNSSTANRTVLPKIEALVVRIARERPSDAAFMAQCARQPTDPIDGCLPGKRYLIHDRDTKFTAQCDRILRDGGVEPLRLPPQSPNLNAHAERFVRSIKEAMLDHLILFNERLLRYALKSYLAHYHQERNYQGLENQLIEPIPKPSDVNLPVLRHDRLGGLLSYYYREAA